MAWTRALGVLALLLSAASAARTSGMSNDMCGTCKEAVRVMKDLMCDPGLEGAVEGWVIDNLCPATGDTKSCADIVNGIAPALFDWVRLGTDADAMCAEVGVCGAAPPALFGAPKPKARRAAGSSSNDMTCPLCMFVVSKVKDGLSDPVTREAIHDRTTAACGALPEGSMREACTNWANEYEDTLFKFVDTMEASDLCALIGSCSLLDKLLAAPAPRLNRGAVAALAPVAAAAARGKDLAAANGPAANDNCDTCKMVVAEMHSALANPDLQAQVTEYAKAVCASMGSFADACKEHVDQYAPMAFGMVLAYLQPEQICRQLHMCPPPSLAAQMLDALSATLRADLGALMLSGRPLPLRAAAADGVAPRKAHAPSDALALPA